MIEKIPTTSQKAISSVADNLREQRDEIIQIWKTRLRARLAQSQTLDSACLEDLMPQLLVNLTHYLESPHSEPVLASLIEVADQHGEQRANLRIFTVPKLVLEFQILRETLFEKIHQQGGLTFEVIQSLNTFLDRGLSESIRGYEAVEKGNKVRIHWRIFEGLSGSAHNSEGLLLAQDLLEQERVRLEELFMQSPVPICLTDGPEHRVVLANSMFVKTLFGKRDIVAKPIRLAVPELEEQNVFEVWDRVYASGIPEESFEKTVWLKQDDETMTELVVTSLHQPLRDLTGRVYGICIVVTDVTEQVRARKVILESERRFRTLADAMPQIVWSADSEGEARYANQRWFDYAGGNSPREWRNFVHPEDLERVNRSWSSAVRELRKFDEDIRLLRASDQTYRWHLVRAVPAFDLNQQVSGWYGSCTDITEQMAIQVEMRRTTEALRTSQSKLAQAIRTAHVGFWNVELPGAQLTISPQMAEDWGIATNEASEGLDEIYQRIHPEDRGRIQQAARAAKEFGAPYRTEYRVIKPSGEVVWIEARGDVFRDVNGVPLRFTGTSMNITSSVLARLEVEASARDFKALADSMPQIVWTANASGTVQYVNQKWFEYTGQHPESSAQAAWIDSVFAADLKVCSHRWNEVFKKGDPYECELRLRRKDGVYRWHLVRASSTRDEEGRIVKWFGTNTDIHEQKMLSEELNNARLLAERANESKSVFLANMSHEIRTPLASVIGFLDLLKDPDLPRDLTQGYLGVIERNSSQLLRIIDDILDLSKVEAGKLVLEETDFSLIDALGDVCSMMELRAKENGVRFLARAETDLPSMIRSDSTRIRQILTNVIGNAIKFTEHGEVRLALSYDDGTLGLKVSDTGRGISVEQRAHLFQLFSQADASTTRKYGGTGLGLVLTKTICNTMGGDFWLEESEMGRGSTFRAEVRICPSSLARMVAKDEIHFTANIQAPTLSDQVKFVNLRILVVEDSLDNQILTRMMLKKMGIEVEVAADGIEGVQKALSQKFSLILMDVQMPQMDGYQATRELRNRGYRGPIIALTAHAMKEERDRCMHAGYTDFLSKPVNRNQLAQIIQTHCSDLIHPNQSTGGMA